MGHLDPQVMFRHPNIGPYKQEFNLSEFPETAYLPSRLTGSGGANVKVIQSKTLVCRRSVSG